MAPSIWPISSALWSVSAPQGSLVGSSSALTSPPKVPPKSPLSLGQPPWGAFPQQRGWGALEPPLLQLCEDGEGGEGGEGMGSSLGVSLPAWGERYEEHWPKWPQRSPHTPRLLGGWSHLLPASVSAPTVLRARPLAPAIPRLSPAHCPIMQAILQATAEMRAAPRPLPSSDWMKVMSQPGVSCRTVAWKWSLKLGSGNTESQMGSRLVGRRERIGMSSESGSPPGMELVDRAINTNSDLESVLAAALPHAVDDTSQPG